jgi:NADPH:quinone reductase-like Zn-dependent oxidoreductase
LVERQKPTLGAHTVLLRMRAFSLNARDLQTVQGRYPVARGFPLVPLSDGVGEVVARGESVTRVSVGDRVAPIFAQRWLSGRRREETWASTLASNLDGVLAEYVALDEQGVVRVPRHLGDVEAATLTTAGVTAWEALVARAGLARGDRVLVQGTGNVSLFALQFITMLGAHAFVISSSEAKLEKARALGAAGAVLRTLPDWAERVRALSGGEGVDHVLDVAGDLAASLACLRTGGSITMVGYLAKLRLEVDVFPWLLANGTLRGVSVGPRDSFEAMNAAVERHEVRPVIWKTFEFEHAHEAFRSFGDAERFGKVVITL